MRSWVFAEKLIVDLAAVTRIDQTIKSARRYQEILTVLIRNGFKEFLIESGLGKWAKNELNFDLIKAGVEEVSSLSREERLRKVIEELGPTFIKVGQILSTRPDLIPAKFAEEFKKLQADVSPLPFDQIKAALENEFPGRIDDIFASIDPEPLACASLAQTHVAERKDGKRIVLKILKPGVRQQIEADIAVMNGLAGLMEDSFSEAGFSPKGVAREFSRQLEREIDLINEGRSTERLRTLFEDDSHVRFPEVFFDISTRNVLALELIEGRLLSNVKAQELDPDQRRQIVENATDAVFRQCFELGFFHADPHPGNIFILPGNAVCFIDCGMTGRIDKRTTDQLAQLMTGVAQADLERVIEAALALSEADRIVGTRRAFRNEVWDFISRFQDSNLASLDIGKLLSDFFELLRNNRIQCPSDIVFLIKAVTTIEGVAEELDPEFDVVSYVKPYLEEFVIKRYSAGEVARRTRRALVNYAEVLEILPFGLRDIIERMRRSRFPIKVEHRGLDQLTETVNHVASSVSMALVAAALFVGSAILILADKVSGQTSVISSLGIVGVVFGVLIVIRVALSNYWFSRRK